MSAQPGDRRWYITRDGKRYGPYTFEALAEAAAKGVIDAKTSVWRLGWVQWHPAGRVPGLIPEIHAPPSVEPEPEPEEAEAISSEADDAPRHLDPAEVPPLVEQPPARETWAPPPGVAERQIQRRDYRASDRLAGKEKSPAAKQTAEEGAQDPPEGEGVSRPGEARRHPPPLVAEARLVDPPGRKKRDNAPKPLPRLRGDNDRALEIPPPERERPAAIPELPQQREPIARVAALPPQPRNERASAKPAARRGGLIKIAALAVLLLILVAGAGWAVFRSGFVRVVAQRMPTSLAGVVGPRPSGVAPAGRQAGLPQIVATLPAVEALAAHDRPDYDRFVQRFAALAVNASEDEMLSFARLALRRSVRRLLANASDDALLEITDTYLEYMKTLVTANPESCVALSDENKGAKMTANFAKDYPILFIRDMAVMERIASTDPKTVIPAPTAQQAQPLLENLFKVLRSQPVKADLLARDKLTPADYEPYCQLVIAFYDAVLAMPRDDKVNLLRYLYSVAAVDADDDMPK